MNEKNECYYDWIEMIMGERINEVLQNCKSRRVKYRSSEAHLRELLDQKNWETVNKLLEQILECSYEDCRTAYCAGMEDGLWIARKILTI